MSLERASQLTQTHHILYRIITPLAQRRILRRNRMSLGENETIPSLHLRILRIDVHLSEIQRRKNIRRGQGTARMPGTGVIDGPDHIHPHPGGDVLIVLTIFSLHLHLLLDPC